MNVYKKLLEVQKNLKAPKNCYNSFGKYNYRNCEAILEALKPILSDVKATIIISDNIENIGNRYYIKSNVKFIDTETGDFIEGSALAREEETKKGVDASQLTGSTSSYARKYALSGMFALDDNKDADSTNTHGKSTSKSNLSDAQIKRLYAIAYKCGIDKTKIENMIKDKFNKTINELAKSEYDQVCEGLQARIETLS